jgi:hypothetical protein
MNRLSRLVKKGAAGQEPLPPPFASWEKERIRLRRNSVHLWAGPSASFKTMTMINAIMNMKVPTLVFSTDSDESTIASRMLGILSGTPVEQTEGWLNPNSAHLGNAARLLAPYDFIRWDFAPSPTLDDVWNGAYAYATVEGCWPDQIVVDIVSDLYLAGHKDEWSMLKELMRQGKVLARETGAAVHLMHHVTDSWKPSREQPVPSKGDVLGKLSGIPVVMMNFAPGENGEILAACVKNRFAKCDPSGRTFIRMHVEPDKARVTDYIPGVHNNTYQGEGKWWEREEH